MGSGAPTTNVDRYLPIGLKAKYSFYSALVFFLIANPETYKLTQMIFGRFFMVSTGGCPTPAGLFFHSVVFFFVLLGLMLFPRDI
jgi:hypothetical protein